MAFTKKTSTLDIRSAKNSPTPLVCMTSYTANMASIADRHCDLLLVGDSLGMVLYGMDSTLPVSMEMMIWHAKAVVSHAPTACVVVDMPFGSYEASKEIAFTNASRLLKETGAQAIKLEGGTSMASTISFLVERGVPVMGHIGLQPQSVHVQGGYQVSGKTEKQVTKICRDAIAVEKAGAFATVIECTQRNIADSITKTLHIPTIGIGASPECDGQILVLEDVIGLSGSKPPRFVEQYANLADQIDTAIAQYAKEVRGKQFPQSHHCYDKAPELVKTVKKAVSG